MSGPESGKYHIRLVEDPQPLVGVEIGGYWSLSVITDGTNNDWIVTKLPDGKYTLAVEISGNVLYIQEDDGKLVGSDMPSAFLWAIEGEDGGPYTIQVPSGFWPGSGWSVDNPAPKQPVIINKIEDPGTNQLWTFVPLGLQ